MRFLSFPATKNVTDGPAQTNIIFTLSSTTEFFGQRRPITNELRDPELSITVKNMGSLIIRPSKTYYVVCSGRPSVRPLTFRDILIKLDISINDHQTMCREQESTLHLHFSGIMTL